MLVAIENMVEGKTVEDNYAALTTIYYRHLRPGDLFWGRVAGAAVLAGEPLDAETVTGHFIATTLDTFDEAIVIVAESDALTTAGRLVKLIAK